MYKLIFLMFSSVIVILSIISICIAPIINKVIKESDNWKFNNCQLYADEYSIIKDEPDSNTKDERLKSKKKEKNLCNRQKAMYGLEYSAFFIDLIFGFVCFILGLFHYFYIGKDFIKKTGLIGLGTGIVGFVITLIYVCYSAYIFANDNARDYDRNADKILKLNTNGAYAEWDDSKGQYKCLFYKENDPNSVYAKYKDLGDIQYNYDKENYLLSHDSEIFICQDNGGLTGCSSNGYYLTGYFGSMCKYLYYSPASGFENKYVYERWVTTIIFSCIIIVIHIGMAFFGFLLFKK